MICAALFAVAFCDDALGRLVRTERHDRVGNVQVERYAYDGVRRIRETEETTPAVGAGSTATREYVYGPDGVDEVVAQLEDTDGDPVTTNDVEVYFYLLDANYNVVALTDDGSGGLPAIARQYAFSPYGTVFASDTWPGQSPPPATTPTNAIGPVVLAEGRSVEAGRRECLRWRTDRDSVKRSP